MTRVIQAADFSGDLSREDTINLTRAVGPDPTGVSIRLETAPNITWWKAIELIRSDHSVARFAETQDANHGPVSLAAAASEITSLRLRLSKAKLFGIHTGMYELDLASHVGRELHLNWVRDDDRDGPVIGFFRDLGDGISSGASAIASGVEAAFAWIGRALTGLFDAIGTGIAGIFEWVGGLLGRIPVIGPLLQAVFHWIGALFSAIFAFIGVYFNAIANLIGGVVAGVVRVIGGAIGGLLAWDGNVFVRGLGDVVAGIGGAVVAVAAAFVGAVQAIIPFVQPNRRPLTSSERQLLSAVFAKSIVLENIQIVSGRAGLYSLNDRSFTIGNTIYMKDTTTAHWNHVLVHECTHVWQYLHLGTRYVFDALWSQTRADGYDWQSDISHNLYHWVEFSREAQAQFIEDAWQFGRWSASNPPREGAFFTDNPLDPGASFVYPVTPPNSDYTFIAREATDVIRG